MSGEVPPVDRAQLEQLQLERLRDSLRRAAGVPHYAAAFRDAGVSPEDITSLADLVRFPFTTKADLRANYPFGMLAVPREEVARLHASSGTTGKPTVVGYTATDVETWAELMARSIRSAGGCPGDLVHVAYGYGLFTGGLGAHYGAERLGCTVVPVSGGMTARQVQLIADLGPRIIMVTPSYFLALLDEMEAQGIDPRATGLEIGIFGAEPWTDQIREAVQERSGIRAVGAERNPQWRRVLRALGGDGAWREPGVGGDPGRAARLGGPLPARGRRPWRGSHRTTCAC